MVIPEVRQERLYQKIANLIIKLINDNIFPPGTFLPPERELAKQLGVSRASLREALIVLEISGWIVIQSGNGVIVSDKKHLASDYTIEEILSTRELVDSHCARLAAQNDNVDVINQIEAIYHRMDQAIREIQLLMILFPAALTGPSAIPKRTRTISIVHNPVTKPVKPQNTDHSNAAMRKTVFGPTLSLAQPPIKLNRAYPIKNALKIIPISAALNPNSFSIKGAVIDNAERSI